MRCHGHRQQGWKLYLLPAARSAPRSTSIPRPNVTGLLIQKKAGACKAERAGPAQKDKGRVQGGFWPRKAKSPGKVAGWDISPSLQSSDETCKVSKAPEGSSV